MNLTEIISNPQTLNVYRYGSIVYGTNKKDSDQDFVVIVSNDAILPYPHDEYQLSEDGCDFNVYTENRWLDMVMYNNIIALECCSLPSKFILKETRKFDLEIDLIALRIAISSIVSNSWVKGKKKFEVEADYNPLVAKKSIWHCFRILMFGIQACEYGKITDLTQANSMFDEIMNGPDNWDYYKANYQEKFNNLKSQFKKYSEKEWIEKQKLNNHE
jgi:predicted nucleotidyltransferase